MKSVAEWILQLRQFFSFGQCFMKRSLSIRHAPQKMIGLVAIIYGVYLFKTAMGIDISNSYSAPKLIKVPLQPLWENKTELCAEFQTLCTARSNFYHKVQRQIDRIKIASHAG
jgi:hypothetical protein